MTAKQLMGGCLLVLISVGASAQTNGGGQSRTTKSSAARTQWGDPDLRGVWDYWTFTPLERPSEFANRAEITAEEAAKLGQQGHQRALQTDKNAPAAGDTGAYSQEVWTDRTKARALTQTSIIVDPPDGKIPPLTDDAKKRLDAQRAAGGHPVRIRTGGIGTDGPEDRGVAERCLLGFSTGPPMLPGGYNNNIQIFQTRDFVAILLEMNHDTRFIPLDGRPHLPGAMRQWMGDSRGHWEGNTLVVETTNFTDKTASISLTGFAVGSAERLKLTERFTRVNGDTLSYEFTVNDPSTFTRPFTGRLPMNLSSQRLYEYACHEGNYGMFNMLAGARAEDARIK